MVIRPLLWVMILALLGGSGCISKKANRTARPSVGSNLIVTPANVLAGRVLRVNKDARFVVLAFPIGQMPRLEQHLILYRSGLKTGEVKITGPQRDDKIVADILSGDAAEGDEVRDQ